MQNASEFAVSPQFHEDAFVQRETDEVERLLDPSRRSVHSLSQFGNSIRDFSKIQGRSFFKLRPLRPSVLSPTMPVSHWDAYFVSGFAERYLFLQKHYCDYCDVFLTHDSTSVRKAHNNGRNHLSNVRDYYACASFHIFFLYAIADSLGSLIGGQDAAAAEQGDDPDDLGDRPAGLEHLQPAVHFATFPSPRRRRSQAGVVLRRKREMKRVSWNMVSDLTETMSSHRIKSQVAGSLG